MGAVVSGGPQQSSRHKAVVTLDNIIKTDYLRTLEINQRHITNQKTFLQEKVQNLVDNDGICAIST